LSGRSGVHDKVSDNSSPSDDAEEVFIPLFVDIMGSISCPVVTIWDVKNPLVSKIYVVCPQDVLIK
jgi:hypothetical protein